MPRARRQAVVARMLAMQAQRVERRRLEMERDAQQSQQLREARERTSMSIEDSQAKRRRDREAAAAAAARATAKAAAKAQAKANQEARAKATAGAQAEAGAKKEEARQQQKKKKEKKEGGNIFDAIFGGPKNFWEGGFEEKMSRREAAQILGIRESAAVDKVKTAHRTILMANHPDKGGSPYVATKINEAKELLLKGRGGKGR